MSEPKFPVPDAQLLPGDPLHPRDARLPVSGVAAALVPNPQVVRLDLRCPRKTDVGTREDVFVTRRFLLSKEGARSLVHEILQALDQE